MARTNRLNKGFQITSVAREDLEFLGFDTSRVNESTMKRLADKMAEDYWEQLFWSSLQIIAEGLNIPIRKRAKKQ